MAIDDHVGARIRERRIMLGLTQLQLAEVIGVTYQQLHNYERGINRVSAWRLFEIAPGTVRWADPPRNDDGVPATSAPVRGPNPSSVEAS